MNTSATTYKQERETVINAYVDSFREAFDQVRSNPDLNVEDLFDLSEQLKWADNSWDYADSISNACNRLAGDDDEAYEIYMNVFRTDYKTIFTEAAQRFYRQQVR